ncbi:MAG: SMI1/KNR4 family protein [Lachnospiraceae bacterium]|nr:SMI1/KNR4 family protein [Lachnospiraceae bacterium]
MNEWDEILEQIKSISKSIYSSINAPADISEIQLLEKTVGVELPEAFCEYLSTLNGQKNTEESTRNRNTEIPLLGLNPFLSVTGIIETWNRMYDLFADDTEPLKWVAEDKIKPFIWRKHWIPFTEFEGSQCIILDCDPGKNGTYGQVFIWCPGMDYAGVIANSFEEFSKELLFRLSVKKFELTEWGTIKFEDYYI